MQQKNPTLVDSVGFVPLHQPAATAPVRGLQCSLKSWGLSRAPKRMQSSKPRV